MLLEAQETAQLVEGMLEDWKETTAAPETAVAGKEELELLPMADSDTQGAANKGLAARSWSVSLMRHGNCLALRELFQTTKGEQAGNHAAHRRNVFAINFGVLFPCSAVSVVL